MTAAFYAELPVFTAFEEFHEARHYHEVPNDWVVYVTDVVGSTGAIAAGRYKDVNTIGAACITAVLTRLPTLDIPFVFGGDGATLCLPPAAVPVVDDELGRLITLAQVNFGLDLRVARIRVAKLRADGHGVRVARFALASGNTLACFRGGGLAHADRLAKQQYRDFAVPAVPVPTDELVGLSCRWSPIPTRKDCVLSLLVVAREGAPDTVYADVVRALRDVLGGPLEAANPISLDHVRYSSVWRALRDERRYHARLLSRAFLARVVAILSTVLIFRPRRELTRRWFDRGRYTRSVPAHCDYRKFDDTLRLVLDCTTAEADAIEAALEAARRDGALWYGVHRSREALMTCFVRSSQDGEHLHFVDGGTGGFALAAKQLKAQLAGAG